IAYTLQLIFIHYCNDNCLIYYCCNIRTPRRYALFPYTTLFRSKTSLTGHIKCQMHTQTTGLRQRIDQRIKRLFPAVTKVDSTGQDRKSTRLNSSHVKISYAVFCLKKKNTKAKEEWNHLLSNTRI